ncbi:MAG: basic secretory family protein [Firmicutes bacterium]|nr:basic secretory family protein [Bacillota bacterium]
MKRLLLLFVIFSLAFGVVASAAPVDKVITRDGSGSAAECKIKGHLWCGVTGNFEQRPGPGKWTDHPWWYEICGRVGCSVALPLSDIYLQFLEPGKVGHATDTVWDANRGKSWSNVPADVKERLIHTFNVRWKDIVNWMDFGIVSRIEYVLCTEGVAWAQGRRSALCINWILENPWDTDSITHELIHNAQRYKGIPLWVLEGMADYARDKFGLFNKEAGRMLLPSGRDAKNPSSDPKSGFISGYVAGYNRTATFYKWIEANYNPNFVQELNYSLKPALVTHFQADVLKVLYATTGVKGVNNPTGQGKFYPDGRQFAWLTGITVKPAALEGDRSTVVNALWAGYMQAHLPGGDKVKVA